MSKDYEVIRADHKKDFSGNYGPMQVWSLSLREASDASAPSIECELVQKPSTTPLKAGETVSGDITPNSNPDFPPKFKKEFKEGGGFSGGGGSKSGGGFKPRDPAEIAGARHAHSLLVAAHSFVPLSPTEAKNSVDVQTRIDDLEAFAQVLDEKTKAASDAAEAQTKSAVKPEPEGQIPF